MGKIEQLGRLGYMIAGAGAYCLDSLSVRNPSSRQANPKIGPHIVFMFQDASYTKHKALFKELQERFEGDGLPIGAALTIRPWSNVLSERQGFAYDQNHIDGFNEAASDSKMKVFYILSGLHWNGVGPYPNPLLQKLAQRDENRMKYKDGAPIQVVFQPPADYLPSFMRGMFGTDKNGVMYFSYDAPEVKHFREQNLRGTAEVIANFAKSNPELYLGTAIECEIDYPGLWITKGRELGGSSESREATVREVLATNVRIFKEAGVANLYTNQSLADAENRASGLSTVLVEGANMGVTTWGLGNEQIYKDVSEMAEKNNVGWALPITNPLSLCVRDNLTELKIALSYNPKILGVFSWWSHTLGYSVRGLPFEKAIRQITLGQM